MQLVDRYLTFAVAFAKMNCSLPILMARGGKKLGGRTIPIAAAGGLLWKSTSKGLKIALVHRPRYDDWTLPKGKLNPGESWLEAALREVKEETGYDVRVLGFAGAVAYQTEKASKIVRFWNMTVSGEVQSGVDTSEVSEVAWLSPPEAIDRLSYPLEKAVVEAWESAIARPKAPVAIPT
jgi:8-oxo-(d)GTP phosphatase